MFCRWHSRRLGPLGWLSAISCYLQSTQRAKHNLLAGLTFPKEAELSRSISPLLCALLRCCCFDRVILREKSENGSILLRPCRRGRPTDDPGRFYKWLMICNAAHLWSRHDCTVATVNTFCICGKRRSDSEPALCYIYLCPQTDKIALLRFLWTLWSNALLCDHIFVSFSI